MMERSWYPSHMAKAINDIKKFIHMIDIVLEVCDCRAPSSSRDAALDRLISQRKRILLLNKSDMADKWITEKWLYFWRQRGINALAINAKEHSDIEKLKKTVEQIESQHKSSIRLKNVIVVGIPNVGKSTIINGFLGKHKTKVEGRPGVTRQIGWFRIGNFQIMDTPGILKPKLHDTDIRLRLACIGAVDDAAFDVEEIAIGLLNILCRDYPERLNSRYDVSLTDEKIDGYKMLENICFAKGWLKSGGNADVHRGAAMLIEDFRKGLLGPITLEKPLEVKNDGCHC